MFTAYVVSSGRIEVFSQSVRATEEDWENINRSSVSQNLRLKKETMTQKNIQDSGTSAEIGAIKPAEATEALHNILKTS
jgi:Fic family protein